MGKVDGAIHCSSCAHLPRGFCGAIVSSIIGEKGLTVFRVGLDYGEEVHWPRILEEWSNMIGYEMWFLLVGVYTTAKGSIVENFDHAWKRMIWLSTWQHFLQGEFSRGQVSWATTNLKQETWPPHNFIARNFLICCFSMLFTIPHWW